MLLLYRTQLFGPSDLDNVKAIQAKYKIAPLSTYAGTSAPPAAPPIAWIPPLPAPEERTSLRFFDILAWVLQYCPPFPDEVALRTRLAAVGVVPGKPFDPASLPQATQQALTAGMADGQKQIDTARAATTSSKNSFGSRQTTRHELHRPGRRRADGHLGQYGRGGHVSPVSDRRER